MFSDLYSRVAPACCYITVFLRDERISEGTGFSYTATGEVLTAAHVVTGRWPIRKEDYQDPEQRIFCKFPGLPPAEYKVFFCCLEIDVPVFTQLVQIDLALLIPKDELKQPVPHIPSRVEPPALGESVFMAGYSEEVRLPFEVDKLLLDDFVGVGAFRDAMQKGYMADMMGAMFKRGVVGNIRRVSASNSKAGDELVCYVMYIDNGMHPGASGGPIFNRSGEAVGLVSQRAITRVDAGREAMLGVPSGSTLGISLAPLIHVAKRSRGA